MNEVLKDILISASEIDRYFEESSTNLWRAKKTKDKGSLIGLAEGGDILSNGKVKTTDITIALRNETKWVLCKPAPKGTSAFDDPNTLKGSPWEYYKIPAGTKLPTGLTIVKDNFNNKMDTTNYAIAPTHDMPLSNFKLLLNQLAALVARKVA